MFPYCQGAAFLSGVHCTLNNRQVQLLKFLGVVLQNFRALAMMWLFYWREKTRESLFGPWSNSVVVLVASMWPRSAGVTVNVVVDANTQ